ncbi:MAG: MmcQ/YjbR family DNA-binding protein [Candidatus Neomarinimicrobiota bacterium]
MTELSALQDYLLSKPATSHDQPFGPDVLVFRVGGKIYALVAWEKRPLEVSLKCDPDNALFLRSLYPTVRPGYHLNKKHWNTITLDGGIPAGEIRKMIDESYDLIFSSLHRVDRERITGS